MRLPGVRLISGYGGIMNHIIVCMAAIFIWSVFPFQASAGDPLTLMWMKGAQKGIGSYDLAPEEDFYFISPSIRLGDISVSPYLMYQIRNPFDRSTDCLAATPDASRVNSEGEPLPLNALGKNCFWGIDLDAHLKAASAWFSGIYEKGSPKEKGSLAAFLVSAGGGVEIGNTGLHGQAVYTAGKDSTNKEQKGFLAPKGASYFWSGMMGDRTLSNENDPAGTSSDKAANIMALNLGASHKPNENLLVKADIWYALLAEPGINEATSKKNPGDLGTEIDITVSYEVIKGLNIDMIAAYLITGEASGAKENPLLGLGTQFSLDF